MGCAVPASPGLADVVCSTHAAGKCAMVFEAHREASRRFTGCRESSRQEPVSRQASNGDSRRSLRLSLHRSSDTSRHKSNLDPTHAGRILPSGPSQPLKHFYILQTGVMVWLHATV